MRGKKFISLTLSTMLCLQLLPTASFAAAPATDTGNAGLIAEGDYAIAGNGVRVTYDADGQTITLAVHDMGPLRGLPPMERRDTPEFHTFFNAICKELELHDG